MSNPVIEQQVRVEQMRRLIVQANRARAAAATNDYNALYHEIETQAHLFWTVAAAVKSRMAARLRREVAEVRAQISGAIEAKREDDQLLAFWYSKAERLEQQAARLDERADRYEHDAQFAERLTSAIDEARSWLSALEVYWTGRDMAELGDTPLDVYGAEQVAELLGVTRRRVIELARSRGVGAQLDGGAWLFRRADIEAMRVRKVGRPRKRD